MRQIIHLVFPGYTPLAVSTLRWAARFERLIASISEFFTLRKGIENDHKTK